jgi:peptidoglycan/xylan/chitin deacetylase (PgdA/CDA1 family)/tetratricopeptide (TPR) repeat protein
MDRLVLPLSLKWKKLLGSAAALLAVAALLLWVQPQRFLPSRFKPDPALTAQFGAIADDYRKIIVLMDGAETLDDLLRARCLSAGRQLFWRKQRAIDLLNQWLAGSRNETAVRQLIEYLNGAGLHDADKLAFLDVVEELDATPKVDVPILSRNSLAGTVKAVRDNLQSIQLTYREEVTRIFSQFATRGDVPSREKWDAYVRFLRERLNRDRILGEFEDPTPEPVESMRGGTGSREIFGTDFPLKAVALTFDDGPHPKYTEQVLALLRKYGLRACFFELGINLGTVEGNDVKLIRTADIARKVLDAGHTIANHSYSHPVLPKLPEAARDGEIDRTTLLLDKVAGHKIELFRAPYGARNKEIIDRVTSEGLRSVMWTIDSLDWADPIPESIAMRVLHALNEKQKGIILFHDIHKQSVLALPSVIEELQRQDYTFLAYQNGQFVKTDAPQVTDRSPAPAGTPAPATPDSKRSFYRESWAVIVGINDYESWPKLRYAVNDASAVEETLVNKFGFKRDHIRKLTDREATRQRIMQVLGDEFTDVNKVQREDRVCFFFAGHGATRTFGDGRQIGFIVPVDADRENYVSTAISMTQLRDASDLIAAKHIYFVMDSCYSGLALSRGTGAFSRDHTYLEEVTRRTARQILTAGGADQQVSDDGPGGHSVFTWALLQGLDGKADLDGNGYITASELGAYISPIVASFSKQTPSVGNMVGSEGGEFIFELQPEALTTATPPLDNRTAQLNSELDTLQKEISSKQSELLKLQQSVQAETVKLALLRGSNTPVPTAPAVRGAPKAYDLDRQARDLFRAKKYDDALQKSQQAVGLKPNDPILLNNLGFLYYAAGRYSDALPYLEKTLQLDPKRKEAHGNIAELYLKLGRKAEAKQHFEEYLRLYPNSPKGEEFRKILQTL